MNAKRRNKNGTFGCRFFFCFAQEGNVEDFDPGFAEHLHREAQAKQMNLWD